MDKASEAILGLKPVMFHYKSDGTATPQFGLIAEEVAEANPDLVVRDEKGEIYSVRYEAVNAMLLNEFLKEHRKVEKLEAALEALSARLREQDPKIQRLSDQVERTGSARALVIEAEKSSSLRPRTLDYERSASKSSSKPLGLARLIDVRVRAITRIAANRTQTSATPPL